MVIRNDFGTYFLIMLLNREHCSVSDYFIFTQSSTIGGSVDEDALQSLKMVLISRYHNPLPCLSIFTSVVQRMNFLSIVIEGMQVFSVAPTAPHHV